MVLPLCVTAALEKAFSKCSGRRVQHIVGMQGSFLWTKEVVRHIITLAIVARCLLCCEILVEKKLRRRGAKGGGVRIYFLVVELDS